MLEIAVALLVVLQGVKLRLMGRVDGESVCPRTSLFSLSVSPRFVAGLVALRGQRDVLRGKIFVITGCA